jgi:FixJ family two-component response regulator
MALVVSGLLNEQIALELGTSEKTIKVHRSAGNAKDEGHFVGRSRSHGRETAH